MNELHGYGNKLRERFKDVREESARRLTVGAGLLLRRKLRDQPIDEESRDLQEEDTGEESDHSEESDDTEESDDAEGGGYAGTDDDAEVGRRASENAQRPQHYRCVRRFRCSIIVPARCKENCFSLEADHAVGIACIDQSGASTSNVGWCLTGAFAMLAQFTRSAWSAYLWTTTLSSSERMTTTCPPIIT